MNQSGITLDHVSFRYSDGREALTNLSLTIPKGTFLGITGTNGSGKSTFIQLLNGLIPQTIEGDMSGTVTIDGVSTKNKNVRFFSDNVGIVFQNPDFSLFNLTVREEITWGLKTLHKPFNVSLIRSVLQSVGLIGFEQRDPQSLSMGEKQKVALASILAPDPDYLILDEPTAMLDFRSSKNPYEILKKLNKDGKTIITIEHDTDFLWRYTDKTLILSDGRLIDYDATQRVFARTKILSELGIKIPNRKAV
jgi:energy-coupling factor transport system ATP-binding protein